MNTKRLDSVQLLRAGAVFGVLITHIGMVERQYLSGLDQSGQFVANSNAVDYKLIFGNFGWIGSTGVDLFFVISGFIMVHISRGTASNVQSFIRFLYSRLFRIYPLYWIATFLMLALGMLGLIQFRYDPPFGSMLRHLALLPPSGWPFLDVGWSLIFELYFYVIFGLGYLFFGSRIPLFLGLWGFAIFASYFMVSDSNHWALKIITSTFCLQFIFGAFVGLYHDKLLAKWASPLLYVSLMALLFSFVVIFIDSEVATYHSMTRGLIWGILYASLLLALVNLERVEQFTVPKPLVKIGNVSYSIYLTHVPILSLVAYSWYKISNSLFRFEVLRDSLVDNLLIGTLAGIAAIVFALSFGKWIELPSIAFGRKVGLKLFSSSTRPA